MPLKKELKNKLATAKQEQKAKIEELKALIQTQKQKIVEIKNDSAVRQLEQQLRGVRTNIKKSKKIINSL